MGVCDSCMNHHTRPCEHSARTREYYDILIKPLRKVAERYGYALAVHGSLGYDIDLIACPWRQSACDAESLAEAIRATAEAIIGIADDRKQKPTKKPAGRLAWSFYLVPEDYRGPYIDLSVMPIGVTE